MIQSDVNLSVRASTIWGRYKHCTFTYFQVLLYNINKVITAEVLKHCPKLSNNLRCVKNMMKNIIHAYRSSSKSFLLLFSVEKVASPQKELAISTNKLCLTLHPFLSFSFKKPSNLEIAS